VEATSDYFEVLIGKRIQPDKELSKEMEALYHELVGTAPDPTKAEELLNDAYGPLVGEKPAIRRSSCCSASQASCWRTLRDQSGQTTQAWHGP
jgi:hypothetical protein